MEQRTCRQCAVPLTGARRKWCSEACRSKFQYESDPAAFLNRQRAAATHRGTYPPFDCATCSKRCVPGENVAAKASKFCSRRCKRQWHKPPTTPSTAKPDGWMPRRKRARLDRAQRKLDKAAVGTSGIGRRTLVAARCADCAAPFVTPRIHAGFAAVFCSDKCSKRAEHRKRRAVKAAAFVANVYTADIYERDGYRCQLCNKPVKRDAVVPHPKAPVLDHIIPLAKGGTHEPANVQLAHFMCNSIKSDNIGGAGDQLRLIG